MNSGKAHTISRGNYVLTGQSIVPQATVNRHLLAWLPACHSSPLPETKACMRCKVEQWNKSHTSLWKCLVPSSRAPTITQLELRLVRHSATHVQSLARGKVLPNAKLCLQVRANEPIELRTEWAATGAETVAGLLSTLIYSRRFLSITTIYTIYDIYDIHAYGYN